MKKIGAQSPHSEVLPNRDSSSGKIEIVASKDDHLVASLSTSNTKSLFKASDADSAIHNKHKSCTSGKMAKRRSHQKRWVSNKCNHSSSSFSASDAETSTTSPASCQEASTFQLDHDRRHRPKNIWAIALMSSIP